MPRFFQEIAGLIMGMIKGIMVVNNPLIVPYFLGGVVHWRGISAGEVVFPANSCDRIGHQ